MVPHHNLFDDIAASLQWFHTTTHQRRDDDEKRSRFFILMWSDWWHKLKKVNLSLLHIYIHITPGNFFQTGTTKWVVFLLICRHAFYSLGQKWQGHFWKISTYYLSTFPDSNVSDVPPSASLWQRPPCCKSEPCQMFCRCVVAEILITWFEVQTNCEDI